MLSLGQSFRRGRLHDHVFEPGLGDSPTVTQLLASWPHSAHTGLLPWGTHRLGKSTTCRQVGPSDFHP